MTYQEYKKINGKNEINEDENTTSSPNILSDSWVIQLDASDKERYKAWKETQNKTNTITNIKNETMSNSNDDLIIIHLNNDSFWFTKLEIILIICTTVFVLVFFFLMYKKFLKKKYIKNKNNLL